MGDMLEALKKAKMISSEKADEIEKEKNEAAAKKSKQQTEKLAQRSKSQNYKTQYSGGPRAEDIPPATAPYNFIPMVHAVLPSPMNQQHDGLHMTDKECQSAYSEYIHSQPTYSGSLNLRLENLTPLFVGAGKETEFFSPAGKPMIPGSTLRGMVRSLFKIITAGAMRRNEDFTDRHLYFRCLMAPKSMPQIAELHDYYVSRMTTKIRRKNDGRIDAKNTKPGFLFRKTEDGAYYISPCQEDHISIKEYDTHWKEVGKVSRVDWYDKDRTAYILTGNQSSVLTARPSANRPLKKNIRYLYGPDWQTEYPVPESVIQDYRDDKNRRGVYLINDNQPNTNIKCGGEAQRFAKRDDIDFLAPCYFVLEDNQVQAFGHGRWFRIPYRKSVGDRIDNRLEDENIVDFTDAVFGRKALWAGRVSFEDAQLQSPPAYACKDYVIPLMKANPTSYQLYLEQSNHPNWPPAHWDSPAAGKVRGYKMYWHQQIGNNDWRAQYSEGLEQHTNEIHPLTKNNIFTGKIHFRNLTAVELGALLKVFQLGNDNQDIVYKLGLGKSLGMGSVRIQANLSLDSGGRYTALFDKDIWKTSEDVADTTPFLKAFADYVSSCFGKDKKIYQEYQKSLDTLALMLDWNHTKLSNWNDRVATMCEGVNQGSISGGVDERFKLRCILPTAEEVVKGKNR